MNNVWRRDNDSNFQQIAQCVQTGSAMGSSTNSVLQRLRLAIFAACCRTTGLLPQLLTFPTQSSPLVLRIKNQDDDEDRSIMHLNWAYRSHFVDDVAAMASLLISTCHIVHDEPKHWEQTIHNTNSSQECIPSKIYVQPNPKRKP